MFLDTRSLAELRFFSSSVPRNICFGLTLLDKLRLWHGALLGVAGWRSASCNVVFFVNWHAGTVLHTSGTDSRDDE